MTDRRTRVLRSLNTETGRGLEIGPLHTPIATKDKTNVLYVDVHLAQGLRDYYESCGGVPLDEIVDVDFALIEEGKTRKISEAVGDAAPFDWVVASHVIEHVPDVIGWLADVSEILRDDGIISLAVPDRRYCFDARRPPTTVGDMMLARHHGDARPSVRAVFDHYSSAVTVTPRDTWRHGPPGPEATIHDLAYARMMLDRSTKDESYVDCHVWLFTPITFVQQMRTLADLGLFDYTIESITPTAVDDMEFFVTLRRVPRNLDEPGRRALFAEGFPEPEENVISEEQLAAENDEPTELGESSVPDGHDLFLVSNKEQRLIEGKRAALLRLRRLTARLRRS
ncbi:methyltransferase family protein [Jatrophihabitans sp. GAS493]|uniref:methyltransferase domain-containing protein n=1 Tax=Jatrophihabitans sp. GAS493 TaxID=1907575 RepID=UPI000BB8F367|nr:methyltransferase domain-containing protein [Jatrophihabitans sp. GAS493]SOD70605.1 methyltransferase family protein [Jatrophihabitans sp. GAS493]